MKLSSKLTALLLIAILMSTVACDQKGGSSFSDGTRIDRKYREILDGHGLIVITNAANDPIDFFRFPRDPVNELYEIEIFTNPQQKELGFYLAGELINSELETRYRYKKTFESTGNHYLHNGAKFEVRNRKIASYMGSGFSEQAMSERQLEFVYANFANPDYQHTVEIMVSYVIDEYFDQKNSAQIIASYNLANGEIVLRRDTDIGSGITSEELDWRNAEHHWLDWRDAFLKNIPYL